MPDISGFKKDTRGSYIPKDPDAYLTYSIDWSDWLPFGENLNTSSWNIVAISGDSAPLAVEASAIIDNQAVVEISGGSVGSLYTVENTITTDGSETDVRRFRIKVEDRYL